MTSLDDGYQGMNTEPALTEKESAIAGLIDAITRAEEAAQDAEDREKLSLASKHRAKARELKTKLEDLLKR